MSARAVLWGRVATGACSAMRRCGLLLLILVALESGAASERTDETGLSRGDVNPTDLGTRCSVLAGRDDRAYLDCGAPASKPSSSSDATLNDRLRIDPSGVGHEGAGRRYPVRSR